MIDLHSNRIGFNGYELKLAAIMAMLIDHVGAVFFPDVWVYRIIGRITAPIMAFFVAEGYLKTRNVKRYMIRLLLFAVISMIPYYLVFKQSYFNILFDLLLGLTILVIANKLEKDWQKLSVAFLLSLPPILLKTDGMLGISFLVYLFWCFRDNFKKLTVSVTILYGSGFLLTVAHALYYDAELLNRHTIWVRPLALLALPLIKCYNGERGKHSKYLFYLFYPVHLLLLYLLTLVI